MRTLKTLTDRTAVLFLGVAAGAAIGYAFGGGNAPAPRPVMPAIAPPPPPAKAGAPAKAPPPPAECALPFQPHLLAAVAEGRKVRIGVFGDSYGDGIWSALYRLLPAKAGYEVIKFSQQSTGFTRYASLNLEEHAREQLAGDPVDVAVISFGANDTQGVMVGSHAAALLSPEWQTVVGRRVDGFVRELRAQGAIVYWVGLPKMRKPEFDADIAGMNAFYARRMKALGVPWMETASLTVDRNGEFAPYLPDGPAGERTLVRANDGIHMSMTGYVRITRALAQRIGDYVAAARTMASVDGPVAATALPLPLPASAAPPAGQRVLASDPPVKREGPRDPAPITARARPAANPEPATRAPDAPETERSEPIPSEPDAFDPSAPEPTTAKLVAPKPVAPESTRPKPATPKRAPAKPTTVTPATPKPAVVKAARPKPAPAARSRVDQATPASQRPAAPVPAP